MRAAVLYGPRDLRIVDVPKPEKIGPHEVLVKVGAVGICGSDVHYFKTGRIGDFVVREPMILGHETSGTVVAAGAAVESLRPGDRVALEPGVPCRRCEHCKTGRYNLCPDVRFFATPPVDGSLCDYVVVPADFAYAIPETISLDAAALIEPVSVAIHACRRGAVGAGQSVFVAGAGPIGLVTLMVARAFGATRVFVSDVQPHRLQKAEELGATAVFHAKEADVMKEVLAATRGRGVDVAIECAGAQSAFRSCLDVTRRGGVVVLVGLGEEETYRVPMVQLTSKEIDIRGIFRYVYTYPLAIEVMSAGRLDVTSIITHRFRLDDVHEAVRYAETGADGAIKVMVEMEWT